ncbi:TIGR00297 family protein [Prochlorococcus marinus]|uniref:TIGR00297 family protein n=1 Tax=Prochlorococcus marinus TaxID=1219 RepID=UPI0022B51CB1|nr:TIGR00297 family protein [Prochlorococcus marinus]
MTFPLVVNEWFWAFIINFILISIVHTQPLLTKRGWVHAGALGTILLACLGWNGWIAVFIYLIFGSAVTKFGFAYKQSKGIAESRGGRRGPENVWGSAATGTIMALLYKILSGQGQYYIFVGFAASFASKLADTFGSEIGKRWGKKTFLITSFKSVPPGTDGAISLEGTLASLLGSLLMTSVMMVFSFISSFESFLIVMTSGFLATIFESIFGALFQNKLKFMTNEFVNFLQTTFACLISIMMAFIIS